MQSLLNGLEWFTRYGFTEIVIGLGLFEALRRTFRRIAPKNCEHLNIDVIVGGACDDGVQPCPSSLHISIKNAGKDDVYISKAYFWPRYYGWRRRIWWAWPTRLVVAPNAARILNKKSYELKFRVRDGLELACLVGPGENNRVQTYLPLEAAPEHEILRNRECGTLYLEYSSTGQSGIHEVRM